MYKATKFVNFHANTHFFESIIVSQSEILIMKIQLQTDFYVYSSSSLPLLT